jgi:ATP-dependent RNA helicase SUPV3L1/SUV3
VEPLPSELLDPPRRERVRRRVAAWLEAHVGRLLGPLAGLAAAADLAPSARAVQFALVEGLGCVARRRVAAQAKQLTPADRRALARYGVRLGRLAVFGSDPPSRDAVALRAVLSAVRRSGPAWLPPAGALSAPLDARATEAACAAAGYVLLGPRAVRADAAERLAQQAYDRAQARRLEADEALATIAGCPVGEVPALLKAIGYVALPNGRYEWRRRRSDRSRTDVAS